MTCIEVGAGVCGCTIRIGVWKIGACTVGVSITSDCEAAERWGKKLGSLNWRECLGKDAFSSPVYAHAAGLLRHPSCPAPVGLLKAMEAEIGAALPVDAAIRFVPEA